MQCQIAIIFSEENKEESCVFGLPMIPAHRPNITIAIEVDENKTEHPAI